MNLLQIFLIHSGVTVQEWAPVTERLPEEKVSGTGGLING